MPHGPAPIYLAGPTAIGKSAVAMELAQLVPSEIISVDSAQVYRGMDIGTAKPTAPERATVPHHLIDIRDPRERYSAARFAHDARRLIGQIRARGHRPVLVGGTMLYFKALLGGLDEIPAADPRLRRQIEEEASRRGWPTLHAELARVDPDTATRIAPADRQRIQRALEVWHLTGRPISALQRSGDDPHGWLTRPRFFCLKPASRAWLHERIAQRFDAMLAAGLVEEVRALHARDDLHANLPSMRCVGYRQVWDTLDGHHPETTLRERGIAATRQLAKRQLTWLRRFPITHTLKVDEGRPAVALAHRIAQRAALDPEPGHGD